MNFLRDICDPYLRLFRKFIPPIGMLDLSPMVAIFVLYIVELVVTTRSPATWRCDGGCARRRSRRRARRGPAR